MPVEVTQTLEGKPELSGRAAVRSFYGMGERTFYRWSGRGMPYEDPVKAGEWWDENRGGRKRPNWLISAIDRWQGFMVPKDSTLESAEGFDISDADFSIEEQVHVQRAIVKAFGDRVKREAKTGTPRATSVSEYRAAAAELRKLEKDAPKISIEQGRAWNKAEISEGLIEIGTAINRGLDNLSAVIASKCSQMFENKEDAARFRSILEAEVNRVREPWSQGTLKYVEGSAAA